MRRRLALTVAALLFAGPAAAEWAPPIGIPVPSFGIDTPQPSTPGSWNATPTSATAGFYYVCRSCPGATDSGNTYGHPGLPRVTVPTSIPEGAYVQVQGTGYTFAGASVNWTLNGQQAAPVWLVGVGNPDFTGVQTELQLRGSFWILKGMKFVNTKLRIGNGSTSAGSTFVALRDSELTGWAGIGTTNMIGFYAGSAAPAHDVVFYNLNVHDNGPNSDAGGDIDQHGVGAGPYSYNLWILDSRFARNSGDGVQINSSNGAITSLTDPRLGHHIYVGRNTFEANLQNGFWTKDARDVIFSENLSFNHVASQYAPGYCGGAQYGPERVWFLFNTCRDNDGGLRIQSDSNLHGQDMYFIGNLIVNNATSSLPSSPGGDDSAGIVMRDMDNRYLLNNTIWGNNGGVHCNTSPMTTFVMVNNIIGGSVNGADADLLCDATAADTTIVNSVFAGNRIRYNHALESLSAFHARTGYGANSRSERPAFASLETGNYDLTLEDTAAANLGVTHTVYERFRTLYGLNIAVDIRKRQRPQDAAWDIGAFERSGSSAAPANPKNLIIVP